MVNGILQNPDDVSLIKANIKEIVKNYSWVLKLNHRELFNTLKENDCILALMCLLMEEECRKYYLPLEGEDENGKLILDISYNKDKKIMYETLSLVIHTESKRNMLGEHLCSFAGVTDGYWKDLEPKGKST